MFHNKTFSSVNVPSSCTDLNFIQKRRDFCDKSRFTSVPGLAVDRFHSICFLDEYTELYSVHWTQGIQMVRDLLVKYRKRARHRCWHEISIRSHQWCYKMNALVFALQMVERLHQERPKSHLLQDWIDFCIRLGSYYRFFFNFTLDISSRD
jgi:hypothetical protein